MTMKIKTTLRFPPETLASGICFGVQDFIVSLYVFHSGFRSAGEVSCGETAKRGEELPHLLSASVWSL